MASALAHVSNDSAEAVGRAAQLVSDPLIEILQLHRALRCELSSLVDEVCDGPGDEAALAACAARYARFARIFVSHGAAEDELLFPALRLREARDRCGGRDAAAANAVSDDDDGAHALERRRLDDARAALDAAREAAGAGGAAAAGTLAAARQALGKLKETLCDHMLEEEENQLPRLRKAFSRAELLQLTGAIMGSRGAEETVATLEIVVPNLEPPQARHMLATMSAVAQGTNFRQWLAKLGGAEKRDDDSSSGSDGAEARPRKRARGAAAACPVVAESYHCPYCDARHPGKGLGVDAFHCMRCRACVPAPRGRPCSREPPFVHVCGDGAMPYEAAPDPAHRQPEADVACACAVCGGDVFAHLELLDAFPCGHVAHRKCLAAPGPPPACRLCPPAPAPAPAKKAPRGKTPRKKKAPEPPKPPAASPLDLLLSAMTKVEDKGA